MNTYKDNNLNGIIQQLLFDWFFIINKYMFYVHDI